MTQSALNRAIDTGAYAARGSRRYPRQEEIENSRKGVECERL